MKAKQLKSTFNAGPQLEKQGSESELSGKGPFAAPLGGELALEQAQSIQMMDVNRDSLSYSQRSKRANTNRTGSLRMLADDRSSGAEDEEDPLKAVALDLSSEANDLDEKSINDNVPKKYSNLDQTIIIGEMEEGNIFEDLKMSKSATETGDKASEHTR